MGWHGHRYVAAIETAQSLPQAMTVEIASVKQSATSHLLKVTVKPQAIKQGHQLRLSWPQHLPVPQPKELWLVTAKLKPPHGYANVAGFNYRRYLLSEHIVATGYVQQAQRVKSVASSLFEPLKRKRHAMEKMLQLYETGALLLTLTLGERSLMTSSQWQVLAQTGTSHLMAISGLHLGICFGFCFFLFNCAKRGLQRLGWLKGELPGFAAYWFAAGAALGYALLAGFTIPTGRALFFILLTVSLICSLIKVSSWRILLLVAALFLLVSPQHAYSTSYWLSFCAVASVLVGLKVAQGWSVQGWKRLVIIQLVIICLMLPLQAAIFGQQSLLAPLINLIVIPWISFSILPLALIGSVGFFLSFTWLAEICFYLADLQLSLIYQWLEAISEQPWQLFFPDPLLALTALALLVLILLSMTLKQYRIFAALASLVPVLCLSHSYRNYRLEPTLDVLDVGQGQAVVFRHGTHAILYDVGPTYPSGFNVADAVLNPYLQQQGIKTVEALILSHSDLDHAGSYPYLWKGIDFKAHYRPNQKEGFIPCRAGMRAQWGTVKGTFFSPQRVSGVSNNDSCVLMLESGGANVLLTGDISAKVESDLVQLWHKPQQSQLQASLLLLAHHGSNSSSSEPFLKAVQPDLAVASAGFRNRWKFPSKQVVERLNRLNVPLYTTANSGQLRFSWNGTQWHPQSVCELSRPVWYQCNL